jgi:hypothetical protein
MRMASAGSFFSSTTFSFFGLAFDFVSLYRLTYTGSDSSE